MLSAHELIEPKSARTSQTSLGSAATVRLRAISATGSPYAARRVIVLRWTIRPQRAGASMSFHPLSPVLLESSTVYFVPSGPVTSPLCGL